MHIKGNDMSYIKDEIEENMFKITYSSGMRLVIENIPYFNTLCIGVWIKTGSSYETFNNNGIAHFIEHILFRCYGSDKSKQTISYLEARGADKRLYRKRVYVLYYSCFRRRYLFGIKSNLRSYM